MDRPLGARRRAPHASRRPTCGYSLSRSQTALSSRRPCDPVEGACRLHPKWHVDVLLATAEPLPARRSSLRARRGSPSPYLGTYPATPDLAGRRERSTAPRARGRVTQASSRRPWGPAVGARIVGSSARSRRAVDDQRLGPAVVRLNTPPHERGRPCRPASSGTSVAYREHARRDVMRPRHRVASCGRSTMGTWRDAAESMGWHGRRWRARGAGLGR